MASVDALTRLPRSDGRWRGRLGSRPLPDGDDVVAALSPADRRAVVESWTARASAESRAGDVFVVIAQTLDSLGAPVELRGLATRAIDDEARHAHLCFDVATRIAGQSIEPPPSLPLRVPELAGASAELRRSLHVIGQCVFNETTASAYLEASLHACTSPIARGATRELLADDIDHARIGWAYLAGAESKLRAELLPWLPRLAGENLRIWTTGLMERPSRELARVGMLPAIELRRAAIRAIDELVLPGLETLGLDMRGLERWRKGLPA